MRRRFHRALVCEAALVRELGELTTLAITRRTRDPLIQFWLARRARFDEFDSIKVNRDFALAKRVVVCASRIAQTQTDMSPPAQAFIAAARRAPLSPRVFRTAQRALRRRIERLEHSLDSGAARSLVEQDLRHANCALAALETPQMLRGTKENGTYEEMLGACCVVAVDGDIGLGVVPDPIVSIGTGRPLFAVPYLGTTDRPTEAVYDRVVARYGKFGAAESNLLFAEDAFEMTGLRTAPTYMRRSELKEAAAFATATARQLRREPKQHDGEDWTCETKSQARFAKRLDQLGEWLTIAAERNHVVIEWVTERPR